MTVDKRIWKKFKTGDKAAFSMLFTNYYSYLYDYGKKITQREDLVKDSIQDFFMYLYENRENLSEKVYNVKAYLISSYRRRLLSDLKNVMKIKISSNKDELKAIHLTFSHEDIVIHNEEKQYTSEVIVGLLERISPLQREIIYLKYSLDLKLPEIAETLSISYQVTANHLSRALIKMRNEFAESDVKKSNLGFYFF
ncbi:RNA polymerase sigma factor [Portibacter marinus]|uniref:RNA polymerase sigma factor n=1 Tax=Portibacter marinus TaxID=2898660 RepID=UPI001F42543F|nr:sigma-70 family RNA polymerase sigma factor [Portibacter marinus]